MEEQDNIVAKETQFLIESFVRCGLIDRDSDGLESLTKIIRLSLSFMFLSGRKYELVLGNEKLKALAKYASETINGV